MAKRDPRAIQMQTVLKLSLDEKHDLLGYDAWGNPDLMRRLIQNQCAGLDPAIVDPVLHLSNRNEGMFAALVKTLRAVVLFRFASLASKGIVNDELRGTIIISHRAQFIEPVPEYFLSMENCVSRLSKRKVTAFIQSLWEIFDKEFNVNLPRDKRIPLPPQLRNIFKATTTTAFTQYQDKALVWLYDHIVDAAAELNLTLPSVARPKSPKRIKADTDKEMPPPSPSETPPAQEPASADATVSESPPTQELASDVAKASEEGGGITPAPPSEAQPVQEPTSDAVKASEEGAGTTSAPPLETSPIQEPTSDVIKVSEEDRVFAALRDFVAESTRFLPAAFHAAALEPARPPLQLLRHIPSNVAFPSDLFVEPSIRRVIFPGIAFTDDKDYSLSDIIALPQSIVLGKPGSGKQSLLTRLAYLVNTRPLDSQGPSLMILINASEYASQAGSQWLPAYAAQKLQPAGCLRDLSLNELAIHLEKFHKTGQLCWGVCQVDSLGNKLEAISFQIRQSDRYIIALDTANQLAGKGGRAAFGDPENTFLIQPFREDQIHRYCTNYAEIACDNFLTSALYETKLYPNLATLPLGLACICAVAGNRRRLRDPVSLYMAERFCRAGLKPDMEFGHSSERQPVMKSLCDIAIGYWRTNRTLEVGESTPMAREWIEQWLTRWSDTKAVLEILSPLYSTHLIVPSHDKDQFIFAQPGVYHLLLAVGCLDQREQQSRRMLFGWEIEQAFGSELPKEIVEMITGLADERCRAAGLDGDG